MKLRCAGLLTTQQTCASHLFLSWAVGGGYMCSLPPAAACRPPAVPPRCLTLLHCAPQVPVVPITLVGTGDLMPNAKEYLLYPGKVKVSPAAAAVAGLGLQGKGAGIMHNGMRRPSGVSCTTCMLAAIHQPATSTLLSPCRPLLPQRRW